jgi:CrcB protein
VLGLFERGALSGQARLLLAVGVLGGYTTFSSFAYEYLQLAETNELGLLLLNAAGQVVLGLLAAYLGVVVSRALWGA